MRYQIPNDEQERLNQLNVWFTQILCSEDYYDDEKWISIRLNLAKWKEKGFGFRQENNSQFSTLQVEAQTIVYQIYNYLSEVLLFEAGIKEAVIKQRLVLYGNSFTVLEEHNPLWKIKISNNSSLQMSLKKNSS